MKNIREVFHIKDTIFLFGKQPVKNDVDQGGGPQERRSPAPTIYGRETSAGANPALTLLISGLPLPWLEISVNIAMLCENMLEGCNQRFGGNRLSGESIKPYSSFV